MTPPLSLASPPLATSEADQIDRFRFALQMCIEHARQPDKAAACEVIIAQVEGAFRVEREFGRALSPGFLRSILEAQEPDDRGLYMQVDESGGRPRRMFVCSLGQLKELARASWRLSQPADDEEPPPAPEPPRPAPQPAREA